MNKEIPKINFQQLKHYDKSAIDLLSVALKDHGFFTIYNHDIEEKYFKKAYASSEAFFNLETDIKNKYANPEKAGARGYTPFAKETALGESVPDLKEFWHHGPVKDSSFDDQIHENIVVQELPTFNQELDSLFNRLNDIGINLLKNISICLHLEIDYFDSWVEKGNSLLRLIHYPPTDNSNPHRAREHADINLITLLIGADEPGLEVKDKNNEWIPVKSNFDEIVCNIGDMMQLITDNKLKSTKHRVIKYPDQLKRSRYSIPFFLHPAPSVMLKSVYKDDDGILASEFLDERLKAIKLY